MADRFPFDRTSKWLIQHHGNSILHMGGVREPFTWKPLAAEVVQPRQLPDGLIEVQFADQGKPDLFLLEISTYPDQRLREQVLRSQALIWLDRGKLLEVLALVLHPKGKMAASATETLTSRLGWSRWQAGWRVIELWTLPARDALAANEIGLVPWIPLMAFDGPPEEVVRSCRDRIDAQASGDERANLLAVTQVLTSLRYDDRSLIAMLGGESIMIESPLLQDLWTRRGLEVELDVKQKDLLLFLGARFGHIPEELSKVLQAVRDPAALDQLIKFAAQCADLEVFRAQLP
jgi:hypothetical protein